jgi:hypothetical protein
MTLPDDGPSNSPFDPTTDEPAKRVLSPAAQRALEEAAERRAAAVEAGRQKELGGREGPEPTRYGDWEKGGIVSDF